MRYLCGLLIAVALVGCSAGTITADDNAKVKADFSQANYEEAMKKAGRGAELQAQKDAAAKRGE